MQIVRVLNSSKKDTVSQAIESTMSSSIYLRSLVRRFTIRPTGTLLKKFERLAYSKLFIILSWTIFPCFVEDTVMMTALMRTNTLLSMMNNTKRYKYLLFDEGS
jgi:hypothetical protein